MEFNLHTVTGFALIALPLLFNISFGLLAQKFDYPDILRQPTTQVLERFRSGGTALVLMWWAFMLSAVLFAPVTVAVAFVVDSELSWLTTLSIIFGVLSSLVQFLGLARWPFVVPYLARESHGATTEKIEMIDLVFQVLNRYLGVAVGEHLGYAFTGIWSALVGAMLLRHTDLHALLGISGVVFGLVLVLCAFEFVGSNEESGWKLASAVTPVAYVLWSLWLVAVGVSFLVSM